MRSLNLIAALALLASLHGTAFAEDNMRDLTVEQATAATSGVAQAHPGSLKIVVTADRSDATYAIGDTARLFITASEDAYVTVLNIGTSGHVTQVLPNAFQPDGHLMAGQPVEIAGAAVGAKIAINGPVGRELIKVIASNKPLKLISEGQLQGQGPFRNLQGGVPTLTRDLEVMSNQAPPETTNIAISNFFLRTVAASPLSAGQETLVVIPGQPVLPTPAGTVILPVVLPQAGSVIGVPQSQPFPLLLASDKPAYRIGDDVTLAVTPLQACNLTVFDVATTGQVKVLFPSAANPANAVAALQTVLIAGGPSPTSLPVVGPAGTEQIIAVCSTDRTPVAGQTPLPDRSALMRDLTVVATRPAGTTAMAALTFTVQP